MQEAEVNAMKEVIPEIMFSVETSAKENTNIEQLFYNLAKDLKDRVDTAPADDDEHRIKLGSSHGVRMRRCTGICSNNESAGSS